MQISPTFDFPLVTPLALFIALPVKFLVDTIKGAVPKIPGPMLPIVGLAVGFVLCLLVFTAARIPFDRSALSQAMIAAIMAQAGAMAATWNQARVEKRDETIEQALKMSANSSVADVKAAVAAKE